MKLKEIREETDRKYGAMIDHVRKHGGSYGAAAKALGVSIAGFYVWRAKRGRKIVKAVKRRKPVELMVEDMERVAPEVPAGTVCIVIGDQNAIMRIFERIGAV